MRGGKKKRQGGKRENKKDIRAVILNAKEEKRRETCTI